MTMDVNYYLKRIKANKCILFLGPEFPFLLNSQNKYDTINQLLAEQGDDDVSQYREDDFFFFRNPASRYRTQSNLLELFEQMPVDQLYSKLVQIPFSLIISLSPDPFFKNSFEQEYDNRSLETLIYKKETAMPIKGIPSPQTPVLLNLFGGIEDEDSLVLSFDDLYEFFSTIFSIKLPDRILTELRNATDFIFVGFKYNAWYLKLLFRFLKIHEAMNVNHCFSSDSKSNDQLMLFYKDHFRFEYPSISPNVFIEKLFSSLKSSGNLRKIDSLLDIDSIDKASLMLWIRENKIKEVIDHLLLVQDEDDIINNQFAGQFTALNQRVNLDLLKSSDPEYQNFVYRLSNHIQSL